MILDFFLGEEMPTVYDKQKLIEYIKLTKPINKFETDQLNMLQGIVFLRDKTVGQVMTKLSNVFMLNAETVLTPKVVKQIFQRGFSRVPIYKEKRNNIVSILYLKVSNLIALFNVKLKLKIIFLLITYVGSCST